MEKAYETYKETNTIWYPKIPKDWKVCKVKYIANTYAGGTPSTVISQYWENGNIPWLPSGKLQGKDITTAEKFITLEGLNRSSTKWIKENTVLVALTGATCANIGYLRFKACANQSVVAIDEINDKANSRFLYFIFLMMREQILTHQTGGAQAGINDGNVKNLYLTLPSFQEQTQIAAYLDYNTNKIDQLITKKETLIQKLQEQRQAIIKEAVTKGLNTNVELKDSGIEWLGDTPKHWEVVRLYGLCYLVRGNSSFKKDELLSNGDYVALQYGKTYKVEEISEEYKFYINDEFYKDSQIVNYGDTIIISTSETIEDLGHSVFYKRNDLGLLGGEQILLKSKNDKMNPKYLFYSTKVFLKELRRNATGVKVFRFNTNDLKNVFTSVPPLEEQNKIAEYIDAKIDKIFVSTEKIKTSIQKLKEYRQSLISEAVTGKIDVRDWQPTNN